MVNLVTTVQNPPWPLVHSYFKFCYFHILTNRLFMVHLFWHILCTKVEASLVWKIFRVQKDLHKNFFTIAYIAQRTEDTIDPTWADNINFDVKLLRRPQFVFVSFCFSHFNVHSPICFPSLDSWNFYRI